jgi:hypothetical protein
MRTSGMAAFEAGGDRSAVRFKSGAALKSTANPSGANEPSDREFYRYFDGRLATYPGLASDKVLKRHRFIDLVALSRIAQHGMGTLHGARACSIACCMHGMGAGCVILRTDGCETDPQNASIARHMRGHGHYS